MEHIPALELKNISKTFGSILANKNVSLTANTGEILAILGEDHSYEYDFRYLFPGFRTDIH